MSESDINFRVEKDSLGERKVPKDVLYGIYTLRGFENFNISGRKVNEHLINGVVMIKKAAAMTHIQLNELSSDVGKAIIEACNEVLEGNHKENFIVDAYQGGAGTSTNMNVNEVIANRALQIIGEELGNYDVIHPINDVNRSQSTNDVYPTAIRIAAIKLLRQLSQSFANLQESLQNKENEYADIIKLGRTQLMDALPMMVGQGFGAYAKAISRDRWRLYKVEERLRQVNIGGTAIGTGMNASKKYIYMVTELLRDITGMGLARSEFPMDITQNLDVYVEVSGLLKSAAVNLMKICNDLRLLASGPKGGIGELKLYPVQAGSSIMPGKVNPVIPEMVTQMSMRVIANDSCITQAAQSGQLELNPFSPIVAESLLESIEMMTKAVDILKEKTIDKILVDEEKCKENLESSTVLVTALVHHIGYDRASEVAKKALKENMTIEEVIIAEKILNKEELDHILNPYQITKPGIPGK